MSQMYRLKRYLSRIPRVGTFQWKNLKVLRINRVQKKKVIKICKQAWKISQVLRLNKINRSKIRKCRRRGLRRLIKSRYQWTKTHQRKNNLTRMTTLMKKTRTGQTKKLVIKFKIPLMMRKKRRMRKFREIKAIAATLRKRFQ